MGFFRSLNWKHALIVLAICTLFFGLRLYKIDLAVNSYYTGYDWATYHLGSEAIVNGKTLYNDVMIPHPFVAYITYSSLSYIFGHTFFDYLRISVFISFLVVLTLYYFFGYVIRDMRYAHMAALLYSIDPLITTLDRGIMLETTGFLYFLWALIFLYFALQSVRRYNIRYIFLFLIFGALASLTKLIFLIPTLFVIGFFVIARITPTLGESLFTVLYSKNTIRGILFGACLYYLLGYGYEYFFHGDIFLPVIDQVLIFDKSTLGDIHILILALLTGIVTGNFSKWRDIFVYICRHFLALIRFFILILGGFILIRTTIELGYLFINDINIHEYYQYVYLNQFGRTSEVSGIRLIYNIRGLWIFERAFMVFYFLLLLIGTTLFYNTNTINSAISAEKQKLFYIVHCSLFLTVFYFIFSKIGGIPRYMYMPYSIAIISIFPIVLLRVNRYALMIFLTLVTLFAIVINIKYIVPGYGGDTMGWLPYNTQVKPLPSETKNIVLESIKRKEKILSTSPAFYLQYSQYLSHDNWFISRHYDTFANLFLLSTTLEPEKYIAKLVTDNVGVYILDPWSATWGGGYGVIMDSVKAYTRDTFELVSKNTDFTIYKIIRIYKENGFSALFHTGERKISFIHPKTFASIYLYPATTSALAQTFSSYGYDGDPLRNMDISLPIGAHSGVLDIDISSTGSMYTVGFTLSEAVQEETIRPYLLDYLSNWGRTGMVTMDNKSLQLDSATGSIELSDDVKDHNLHIDLDTVSIDVGFRDSTVDTLEYVYSPTMGLKSIIPVCSQADKCSFTLLFTQK